MEKIKLLYIDDNLDLALSKYLDKYKSEQCEIEFDEIHFNTEQNYEKLINNSKVKSANLIIIDSRLFENGDSRMEKFTGEEFKIILKKYFPFIEVIVISQNQISNEYKTISKYSFDKGKKADEYYRENLEKVIEEAIKNIFEARKIAEIMNKNDQFERVMIEKINNSIKGNGKYEELDKNDIDKLVALFEDIKENIERYEDGL